MKTKERNRASRFAHFGVQKFLDPFAKLMNYRHEASTVSQLATGTGLPLCPIILSNSSSPAMGGEKVIAD
jgi:hypothetical protein